LTRSTSTWRNKGDIVTNDISSLQGPPLSRFSHICDDHNNLLDENDSHSKNKNNEEMEYSKRRHILSSILGTTTTMGISSLFPTNTPPAFAISPQEASTSYDTHAPTYDSLDGGVAASALGIDDARSFLLSTASGNVLEIGVGTGLNVNKYVFAPPSSPPSTGGVTSLTLVDISEGMLEQTKTKIKALNIPSHVNVSLYKADATSNELVDRYGVESFDTVVDTFSLCVMGNQGARDCLKQMSQLVKKEKDGGRILLIENTRASNPLLGWYQDVTAEAAASAGGKGCLYNQDVTAMIQQTGNSKIVKEESFSGGLFRSFVCVKE